MILVSVMSRSEKRAYKTNEESRCEETSNEEEKNEEKHRILARRSSSSTSYEEDVCTIYLHETDANTIAMLKYNTD